MRKPLQKSTFVSRLRRHILSGLFFVALLAHGGGLYAQEGFDISITDKPLTTAFSVISEQTGYKFVYGDDNLTGIKNVTLHVRNASINSIMDECLKGTGLGYRIDGRDIIIVSPKLQPVVRKRTVTGHVYDENGVPLAGAAVERIGVSAGTFANGDGFFSLVVNNDEDRLKVSFLGMETQTVFIRGREELTVRLKSDIQSIESVIVTGYGLKQKREDLVGSAYQVNASQIKNLPKGRADLMLEGLVPGFRITPQADYSESRQRYSVRIRGESSLNAGGEPLWIVDGVRMYMGNSKNSISGSEVNVSPLSLINPNDIESITVLKDATQTSIYGADGANGVVLITTKRGQKGGLDVTAAVRYGINTIDNSTKLKMLNGPQYLMLAKEAWQNAGNTMSNFPWNDNYMNTYSTTDTDWFDEFFGVGQSLDAFVSVRGGSERMSNYVSFGYFNDRPSLKGNTTNRFNIRFNTAMDITPKLLLETTFGFSYAQNDIFNPTEGYLSYLPIFSPYYEDSPGYRLMNVKTDFEGVETQYRFANSLAERDENTFINRTVKPIGAVTLTYEVIKGLKLSGNFGIDYNGTHDEIYKARTNLSGASWERDEEDPTKLIYNPYGSSQRDQANNMRWSSFESVSFNRMFGKHSVNVLGGVEWSSEVQKRLKAKGYGFPNDSMQEVTYADSNTRNGESGTEKTNKFSFMGRFNYAYDSRYYLTGTYRYDGCSVFGEYHQWEPFASIGASWNVHKEKFFDVRQINKLKFRVSYGSVGNSRIDNVLTNGSYSSSSTNGYRGTVGGVMSSTTTKGLSWERVLKTNIGIDIELFNRLDISFEWYSHRTKDLIADMGASMLTGERTLARNIGIMSNKGIELDITSTNISTSDFTWRTTLNLSHNKNKVVRLYAESSKSFFQYGWYEGYEKNVYTVIKYAGVDPSDGSPMFYDKNGNLTKNYAYDNRVALFDKSRYPTVHGGMTNTLSWRDFNLSASLIYSFGGWSYATTLGYQDDGKNLNNLTDARNVLVETLDRWQKPGDITNIPVLISDKSRYSMSFNTRHLINTTNIRLSNIALSYKLPENITNRFRIKSADVAFIVNNVFVWTPNASKTRNSYKTLMSTLPMQRTFSLELTFQL